MSWEDIASRIKIYGPDGEPPNVNGIPVGGYGSDPAFSDGEKRDLHAALKDLYDRSPTAHALHGRAVAEARQ